MVLNIKWQRLVDDGETCERCGSMEDELETAASKLKRSLKPLNIGVRLKKDKISREEFQRNPEISNAIFIAGKQLGEWIKASTGESKCCDACGDAECRTIVVNGEEYETVPSELIIKAGLKAASQIRRDEATQDECCASSSCCG